MNLKKTMVLLCTTLALFAIVFLAPLRFIDNLFYDLNFLLAPAPAGDSVVVVAIDMPSISARGAWPWTRSTLARLVEQIQSASPRVLALDFQFPYREGAQHNDSLASVFSRTTNLIIPFRAEGVTIAGGGSAVAIPSHVYQQRFMRLVNQERLAAYQWYEATRFGTNDTAFTVHATRGGFINVSTSNTSRKLREIIHVIRAGSEYYPSFGLAAVAAWYHLAPVQLVLDGKGPFVNLGPQRLALNSWAATTFLNYRDNSHPIKRVSAADVLDGTFDPAMLRGKLVFVGVTDPGASAADFFSTPVRSQFPGVEAWATVALDIIEGSWVRWGGGVGEVLNWLVVLLLFPGLVVVLPYRYRMLSLAAGLLVVAMSITLGVVLFRTQHYFWTPANHLYAWFFGLLWLAATKGNPVLLQESRLELEPPTDEKLDILSPPSPDDFLVQIPRTATGVHVLNILNTQAGSSPQPVSFAGETVNGTLVEVPCEQGSVSCAVPDSTAVVEAAQESVHRFRQMAGGQIVRLLGSGGMADVYLVWNPRLELYRAIKVLKPDQNASTATRFETEIRIFAKLNHPAIVQCYGVGDWHSLPYVEMEYINGTSFESILERCGPLEPAAAMVVGILVCRALDYAHTQVLSLYGTTYRGVIHRDIKPANILMGRSGRIKLTDFGIARPVEVGLHTQDSGNVVGTLPYLAPEQLDGTGIGNTADLYALGATLYELATGQRAFPQTDVSSLVKSKTMGTVVPLSASAGIPARFAQTITRAMATRPDERFGSAREMGEELERCLRQTLREPAYTSLLLLAQQYWEP